MNMVEMYHIWSQRFFLTLQLVFGTLYNCISDAWTHAGFHLCFAFKKNKFLILWPGTYTYLWSVLGSVGV